jgi:hypothetical protein
LRLILQNRAKASELPRLKGGLHQAPLPPPQCSLTCQQSLSLYSGDRFEEHAFAVVAGVIAQHVLNRVRMADEIQRTWQPRKLNDIAVLAVQREVFCKWIAAQAAPTLPPRKAARTWRQVGFGIWSHDGAVDPCISPVLGRDELLKYLGVKWLWRQAGVDLCRQAPYDVPYGR